MNQRACALSGVYFIQAGGDRGPIKIGSAFDVGARLRVLQTGSPERLYVLGVVAVAPNKCRLVEHAIQRRFATTHLRGEWYQPSVGLFEFIEACEHNLLPYPASEYVRLLEDPTCLPSGHRFDPEVQS